MSSRFNKNRQKLTVKNLYLSPLSPFSCPFSSFSNNFFQAAEKKDQNELTYIFYLRRYPSNTMGHWPPADTDAAPRWRNRVTPPGHWLPADTDAAPHWRNRVTPPGHWPAADTAPRRSVTLRHQCRIHTPHHLSPGTKQKAQKVTPKAIQNLLLCSSLMVFDDVADASGSPSPVLRSEWRHRVTSRPPLLPPQNSQGWKYFPKSKVTTRTRRRTTTWTVPWPGLRRR